MISVMNHLSIKAEWAEKVQTAFLNNMAGLESQPGFKGFNFLCPDNPATEAHIVQVLWEDQAAFDAWKSSAHFKQSHAGMGELREAFYAPPKLSQSTVIKHIS